MKITHVISDSNIGGAGILLSTVAEGLSDEFQIEIILPEGSRLTERLASDGISITELPFEADTSFKRADVGLFYKYFKQHKPDILHTHASLSSRLGGALAGVRPCISTRHCAKPAEHVRKNGIFQRMLYEFCTDLTVSTADFATENLIAEGVDSKSIVTIKNGSKSHEILDTVSRLKLLHELGIPQGSRIIGSVARLEEVKGQDLALRAVADVVKRFSDVYFLFVGDGSMRSAYKRLSALLGIEKRVRFAGYTEQPWNYQSLFYINLNTSRGTETSCLATSECMAMGIPTVASDFGGNREMIINGENGLLFESDNRLSLTAALCRLLSDAALHRRLSLGAKTSYTSQFSADRMINDYKKLYKSLKFL